MKTFQSLLILLPALLVGFSCVRHGDDPYRPEEPSSEPTAHEMIVLGEKLEDPYSVDNVTKALESLYPTKSGRIHLDATDYYVRFLPADETEYVRLVEMGIELMDHPLDYQILKDGDYYHDPQLAEDAITWQYGVVPEHFRFPDDIRYEILERCYLVEHDTRAETDGIDWTAVEREAYRLTGNEDLLTQQTRASDKRPRGRITIVDEASNGGQAFGVAGVRVIGHTFVKFSSAYTDRDGYYVLSKRYSSSIRYRLMFRNRKGFALGVNLVLIPASMSALGKGPATGLDITVSAASDRKLFTRCVVNNAVYDYYERCVEEDLDLPRPPANLRIWLFQNLTESGTWMMRQGTVLDNVLLRQYLGPYASLISIFLPDITLGLKGLETYPDIYKAAMHELAHATHFVRAGKAYWTRYVLYIVASWLRTGHRYGDGSGPDAGCCEVAEMWAHHLQDRLCDDRYGDRMTEEDPIHWFSPRILRYLGERGLSPSDLLRAMNADVRDRESLQRRLTELYPAYAVHIREAFDYYAR